MRDEYQTLRLYKIKILCTAPSSRFQTTDSREQIAVKWCALAGAYDNGTRHCYAYVYK